MKRLFFKIFLFFLSMLLVCIIIELMIRKIPNEYRYKKEYLDNESDKIEVLFIGASDAQSGLNPAYLNKRAFNASHPGQSLDYCFEILKKYNNKWSDLEYIVLAVSYPTLFYKMEESVESWRVKNYNIYYKINITNHLRSYAEILNGQMIFHLQRIFKYYLKKIDEINCTEKGWSIVLNSESPDSLDISGRNAAKRHTIPVKEQCFEEMKSKLDSIISFSVRNECQIILCTCPAYRSYWENFNTLQWDSTINTFYKVAEQNNNCYYVNLLEDTRFKDEDFANGDHLNVNGAKKLTMMIDSIIELNVVPSLISSK